MLQFLFDEAIAADVADVPPKSRKGKSKSNTAEDTANLAAACVNEAVFTKLLEHKDEAVVCWAMGRAESKKMEPGLDLRLVVAAIKAAATEEENEKKKKQPDVENEVDYWEDLTDRYGLVESEEEQKKKEEMKQREQREREEMTRQTAAMQFRAWSLISQGAFDAACKIRNKACWNMGQCK